MEATSQLSTAAAARPAKGLALGWVIADQGNTLLLTGDDIALFRQLGVQAVRFTMRLGQKPGWDAELLSLYGRVVQMLSGAGIQPIAQITNESVKPSSQTLWNAGAREGRPPGNGNNPFIDHFAQTAAQLVHALPHLPLWVIWNEPNAYTSEPSPGQFTGTSFIYPALFATLLQRTYAAIKRVPGERRVITGGLFGHNLNNVLDETSCGAAYLQAVYSELKRDGVSSMPFDLIGQHYYLDQSSYLDPAHLAAALDMLNRVIHAHEGAGGRDVYILEAGWETHAVSEAVQAANLDQLFAGCALTPKVKVVSWFLLRDNPGGNLFFGLRSTSNQTKPAYAHYQHAQELRFYTVQPGDSLSAIGASFGVPWQSIYETNHVIVGPDPNIIYAGQRLVIPKV